MSKLKDLVGLFNAFTLSLQRGDLDFKLDTYDNLKLIEADVLKYVDSKKTIDGLLKGYNESLSRLYEKYGDPVGDGRIILPSRFKQDGTTNEKYEAYRKEVKAIEELPSNIALVESYKKQVEEYDEKMETEVTKKYKFKKATKANMKDASGNEVFSYRLFDIMILD